MFNSIELTYRFLLTNDIYYTDSSEKDNMDNTIPGSERATLTSKNSKGITEQSKKLYYRAIKNAFIQYCFELDMKYNHRKMLIKGITDPHLYRVIYNIANRK